MALQFIFFTEGAKASSLHNFAAMENTTHYLTEKWEQLTGFSKKEELKQLYLKEILTQYTQPHRFYHNLNHIANLFLLLEKYVEVIENPVVFGFAIFYHDVVYDTITRDNEEKSSMKAREHLSGLNLKKSFIDDVETYIKATVTHQVLSSSLFKNDLPWFLDFDLAILGAPWQEYEVYSNNIRNEFRQYPDDVYNAGRTNALNKILDKQAIYVTKEFYNLYEATARENIGREISYLQASPVLNT